MQVHSMFYSYLLFVITVLILNPLNVCFPKVSFQLQPARVYIEDTFVYYIKTLFHTYIPESAMVSATAETQKSPETAPILPEQVLCAEYFV